MRGKISEGDETQKRENRNKRLKGEKVEGRFE